ncbi:MAG: hypothetical protein WC044_02450 [Crocinitomicaceae bacterium]
MNKSIFKLAYSPLFWLALILAFSVLTKNGSSDNLKQVIRSDGRGYYAYLPAFFIYDDPSFSKSSEAEKRITGSDDQYYLFKDGKGKIHNKYFPGIAILQAPFFGLGCTVSWLMGREINGYSNLFQFFFLLGSLFYSLLGMYFFQKCLKSLFPEHLKKIPWLIPIFYFATPLWYYCIITPNFTHLYSFFLFGLFTFLLLKIKESSHWQQVLLLGLVTGLITLVRPTNILVIFVIPFILGSPEKLKSVWNEIILNKGFKIACALFAYSSVIIFLLFIWRWQTGEWFVWSYKGEGFNWTQPHFWENLFSFRIGLFVHTPLLLLAVLGSYFLYKKSTFQFVFWWIYFLLNMWVISAWWCWDYESPFGNRPTTEHIFFLVMPLFELFDKNRRWLWGVLLLLSLLGIYRFQQSASGAFTVQRFTAGSYFKSLQFWKSYPVSRFNFTLSPEVFGTKISEDLLLDFQNEKEIRAEEEFPLGSEAKLDLPRSFERYGYRVELDKKISDDFLDGVYLVMDASDENLSHRHYVATALYNDCFEGKKEWKHLVFEGIIHDNLQKFDRVKIYIWNQNHRHLWVKNVKITLCEYLAD